MKKFIFIFIIVLLFIFNNNIVKSDEVSLGEFEIASDSFTIDSSVIDVKINYIIDNSITKPKIVITSIKGDANDINDILKLSDDKKTITFGDYSNGETSTSNNVLPTNSFIGLVIVSISSILSFGFYSNNKRSSTSLLILSVIVFITIFSTTTQSLTLSTVSLRIDIKAPSTFKFNSLTLKLGSGSTELTGLISDLLQLDGCDNIVEHPISLNQVSINSKLNICSNSNILIQNLILSSTQSQLINLNTTSNVNLNFNNGYSGLINIISNNLNLNGCQVTTVEKNTTGNCNGGNLSKLVINAENTTITNTEIQATNVLDTTCSTLSTWRPTMALPGSPVSPAISTASPAFDTRFDNTNLKVMADYNYPTLSATSGVTNGFTITYIPWTPATHHLVSKVWTPQLKANTAYTLSFGFKWGQSVTQYTVIQDFKMLFYKISDIVDPNSSEQWLDYTSLPTPIYSKTFTVSTSTTAYQTNTISFTPPFDIGQSIFAIQITRTTDSGTATTKILLSDLKITIPSKPTTTPPLLTVDSELVVLPKPPVSLDPQDTTTCAYNAVDLIHWHDPSIWPGSALPTPSSVITIPTGKRVLISPCSISQTSIYKKIIIPVGSELIFADANMTMNVQDIYVQGKFTMGTTNCRYNAYINIIFNGAKVTTDTIATNFGSKGIAVASGGFISVHGKQYHQTWTKLAATVWNGDSVIYIQDAVNWEVGQQVLITTSIYQDEIYNQNEVLTIKAISGKVIEFVESIKYYHYGGQEYQAEVGLLSRRIVFQGDAASSDSTSFGGHVLINGEGQFAGVQLKKMGQKNMKARYPLHYHIAGTVKNSYISDCAVVNSYYRCYTIHATNNVTLTRNIGFDVNGHCYYLEDGIEVDNTLSFNLAAFVHTIGPAAAGPSQFGETFNQSVNLAQPADSAASGFYITNAWNSFVGNSASGGWAGYAFPNLPKPIGSSRSINIVPQQYPIKLWQGNTAHSSGYFFEDGASIYVGGKLIAATDGTLTYYSGRFNRETYENGIYIEDGIGNNVWMRYNNTKIYLSNKGLGHWGERCEVVSLEAYDSRRPGSIFGKTWVDNAIINGQSGNLLSKTYTGNRIGFEFYDTYVQTILSNINFRNYVHMASAPQRDLDNVVFTGLTFSDVFKPQMISSTRNISFTNVATSQIIGHEDILDSGSSRVFNFVDWDNSVTNSLINKPGTPMIVGAHQKWWQFDNTCVFSTDWNVWVCEKGTKGVSSIEIWIPGFVDREVPQAPDSYIGTASLFGSGITDVRKTELTRNAGLTGVSNMGWYVYWSIGTPAYLKIWCSEIPFGEYIFLAMPYPAGTTFSVSMEYSYNSLYTKNLTQTTSAALVRSSDGSKYYFNGNHLFLKVINGWNNGNDQEYFIRSNTKIPNVFWEFVYHVTARNTNYPPVNTNGINLFSTANIVDQLPSSTL